MRNDRKDTSPFRVTSPVPREVWESLTGSSQDVVVSQSLRWRDAVLASGVYTDVSLLYEFSSGRQVLMPMVQRRWRTPLEPTAASWPHRWGAGGPISRGGETGPAEAAAVLGHVARRDMFGAEIHLSHVSKPLWLNAAPQFRIVKEPYYVLDLAGGFGEVWQRKFKGTFRWSVRKAERLGVDVEVDRSGRLLEVFYGLYQKSIQRWSVMMREPSWFARWHVTRFTPLSMLQAVATNFGPDCATWIARSGGVPVAAMIIVNGGSRTLAWKAAMDKSAGGRLRASHLLQRLAIEEACASGSRFYDMGLAEPGSSLASFKESLGAALHFTHYLQAQRIPVQQAVDLPWNLARRAVTLRSNRR